VNWIFLDLFGFNRVKFEFESNSNSNSILKLISKQNVKPLAAVGPVSLKAWQPAQHFQPSQPVTAAHQAHQRVFPFLPMTGGAALPVSFTFSPFALFPPHRRRVLARPRPRARA
jgi:hypothetical protein